MLFHDDLNQHNILVDDRGVLTGVVDWECLSALPLWRACDYPSFLEGTPRNKEPHQKEYQETADADGEPNNLYWEHLMEYEMTQLRQYLLDEMLRLEPRWIEIFNESTARRDSYTAVQNCDDEFLARPILNGLMILFVGKALSRACAIESMGNLDWFSHIVGITSKHIRQ